VHCRAKSTPVCDSCCVFRLSLIDVSPLPSAGLSKDTSLQSRCDSSVGVAVRCDLCAESFIYADFLVFRPHDALFVRPGGLPALLVCHYEV